MKNLFIQRFPLMLSLCLVFSISNAQKSQEIFDRAWKQVNNQKLKGAISSFSEGIKFRDLLIFNHYYGRAFCYYNLTNYNKAKKDLEIALKIDEKNPNHDWIRGNSNFMMGRIYSKSKETEKELECYEEALNYVQNSELYSTIGFLKIEVDKLDEAKEYLDKAIEINNQDAYAFNNRALVHIKLGNLKYALSDLEKSKKLDSENAYLYKHYALYYIELLDYEKACQYLKIATQKGYEISNEPERFEVRELFSKYCN